MYVNSYLEMHTTLLGWLLYDVAWDVLSQTGMIIFPFMWILFRNWKDASANVTEMNQTTHTDAKKNLHEVMIGIAVLLIAVVPVYPIQPTEIMYSPPESFAQPMPSTTSASSDPSTYKDSIGAVARSGGTVTVPLWWRFLLGLSNGITHAVAESLPTPGDLRAAKVMISSSNIENPELANEYQSFVSNCYVPAHNRFQNYAAEGRLENTDLIKPDDVDWPGSRYLLQMKGGYAVCPGSESRQCGSTNRPTENNASGLDSETTTCGDWWLLIEQKIYDADSANDTLWAQIQTHVAGLTSTPDEIRQQRVKSILNNFNATQISAEFQHGETGFAERAWGLVEDTAATGALAWESISREGALNVIKQAIPMLIAILLMFVYFMLPFAMVFTAYRLDAVISLSFVIFSLIFIHALQAVASWLDYYLMTSLFSDYGVMSWLSGDSGHFLGTAQKRLLINIILAGAYMLVPMVWMYTMMLAGVGAASGAGRLTQQASSDTSVGKASSGAGGRGSAAASTTAKAGAKAVVNKFKY